MRKLVCAAAASCVLAGSSTALASPDFVLDGTTAEMSGKYVFRRFHLLNGAKVVVKKGTDAQPDSGRLYVVAHEILIDETSVIDGTGAGYPGRSNGNGLPESTGGGTGAIEGSDSGGGGGYGGKGGPGVLASCLEVAGAKGGMPFFVDGSVSPGGSGAAAGSKDGDSGGRGGAGGGMVDLRASSLKLFGQVIVDGEAGQVYDGDDSSGGGAGGGIWLQSPLFEAAGGLLRANGAPGGTSSKDVGGSGGGGTISLHVNQSLSLSIVPSVAGGGSPCANAAGGDGVVRKVEAAECVDLDQDGVTSKACGGQDCDDSDHEVKPGGSEVCNGRDDDCDGEADDGADADCAGGACVGGKCVGSDAGEVQDGGEAGPRDGGEADGGADSAFESGIDGGLPTENFEFRGGCSLTGVGGGSGMGALLIVAGGFALNRRKPRRTSTPRVR